MLLRWIAALTLSLAIAVASFTLIALFPLECSVIFFVLLIIKGAIIIHDS